ncbi:MAG: Csu type fimbrial protein [Gammaproteobacteria bacterium]
MMRGVLILLLVNITLLVPSVGYAAPTSCAVSTSNFNFGTYNPLNPVSTIVTGTNLITVTCTKKDTVTVDLSTGGSGTYFPRALSYGPNTLNYNFYTTASLTTIWGNGTGGTGDIVQSVKKNTATSFSVYGQITALQNVAPGSYSDSITVTVSF